MLEGWSRQAADYVDSTAVCPRCGARIEPTLVCGTCRAILSGEEAVRVRAASQRAAEALRERQRLIDLLPVAPLASAAAAVPATAPVGPSPTSAVPRAPGSQGQIGVPSVLAVVGAALVAVAGIVFTFLNPDIAFAARTVIIALLTVLFLGASWLMMQRRLRLSAEALGALGMVFVVLDIWAAVQKTPLDVSGWVPAAVGTLLASLVMFGLALLVRMRVWLWTSIVGFVLVPAMFGYALTNGWAVHAGHVAAGLVAWGAHRLLRRAAGRFGSELRADHGTATTLQLVASGVVVLTLPFFPAPDGFRVVGSGADDAGARVLGAGLVLLALAVLAALGTRDRLPGCGACWPACGSPSPSPSSPSCRWTTRHRASCSRRSRPRSCSCCWRRSPSRLGATASAARGCHRGRRPGGRARGGRGPAGARIGRRAAARGRGQVVDPRAGRRRGRRGRHRLALPPAR
ncbi:hypothetical protein GCM10025881_39710 [Pseudolysinimonas kribbensis]|uniref:DUF2157 domain-containing protein n=1 Tax=Pseudolysinimonas kribbensis TaxID=433641 RepID=A0ABQ6KBE8_9MICO|nr:hypothetical protein GCM10025881_00630 [Pseudolysinimonas kribbensis]GMA97147.1 hypothetical protein GCM10025881_39710 [Pseudolysinimonas kribbensis]